MIINGPEHGGRLTLTFLRVLQVAILDEYDKQTNGLMVTTTKRRKMEKDYVRIHLHESHKQENETKTKKKQQKYKKGTGHI